MLHGGRVSLAAALVIVATAVLVGGGVGWVAASDTVIGRLVTHGIDMLLSLPSLIVALAVVGVIGVGLGNLIFAFVLVGWPWYARIVRGLAVERQKALDILAAQAFGVRASRIFTGHVIPHLLRTLVIVAALDLGYTVAGFAAFSYLGLGAQPPAPEWGAMLNDAQLYFVVAPWLLAGPALAIALTVLATSLLADHLHSQGLAR
jgi:ABC-type dipeptide/oligopeptide/nickel transport system permease subunit